MEHIGKPLHRVGKRITQRMGAQMIEAFAPPGCVLPESVTRAAVRKQSTGPRKHPEEDIQRTLVQWLLLQRGLLFWATPNHFYLQGQEGKIAGYIAKQKKLGMVNGAPDLTIIGRNRHGDTFVCMAEVKSPVGRLSEEQATFLDRADGLGCFTSVVRSLEDMQKLLCTAGFAAA